VSCPIINNLNIPGSGEFLRVVIGRFEPGPKYRVQSTYILYTAGQSDFYRASAPAAASVGQPFRRSHPRQGEKSSASPEFSD